MWLYLTGGSDGWGSHYLKNYYSMNFEFPPPSVG